MGCSHYINKSNEVAVIKPRTRVVFFRVSEEEFREMELACSRVGARSISDFARVAARRCVNDSGIDQLGALLEKLATFEQTLDELQTKVQKVHQNGFGEIAERMDSGTESGGAQ
jgi:hypothetical protein